MKQQEDIIIAFDLNKSNADSLIELDNPIKVDLSNLTLKKTSG